MPQPLKLKATTQSIQSDWTEWNTQNNKAMTQIILNIISEIQVVIQKKTTVKEMWDHINSLYTLHSFNLQYILIICFYNLWLETCSDINDYTLQFKSLLIKITSAGLKINKLIKDYLLSCKFKLHLSAMSYSKAICSLNNDVNTWQSYCEAY